jgi:DnaJ-class molecular chaperone
MDSTALLLPGLGFFLALLGWLAFQIQDTVKSARRGISLKFDIEVSPDEIRDEATLNIKIDDRIIKLKIPRETSAGTRISIPGEGRSKKPGYPRGDLFLTVQVKDGHLIEPSDVRPLKPHAQDDFDLAAEELRDFLIGKFGGVVMDTLERRKQILIFGTDEERNGDKTTIFLSGNGLKRSVEKQDGTRIGPESVTCATAVRAIVRYNSIAPRDCTRWIRSKVPFV